MFRKCKLIRLINGSVKEAELQLQNRKNGIDGEGTIYQIQDVILPELKTLLQSVNDGTFFEIPPQNRYLVSYAYIIKSWGWNLQKASILGGKIARLGNYMKKL
ncbi:MAG: hypothetical protein LBL80_02180 [Ruminococcus sp.]|jgi:hypothetical protein|nr:hypothetical protein [Ruminococcus sp.]